VSDWSRQFLISSSAHYGEEVPDDKPWHTWDKLRKDEAARNKVKELLYCLVDFAHPVPEACHEWADIGGLKARYDAFVAALPD